MLQGVAISDRCNDWPGEIEWKGLPLIVTVESIGATAEFDDNQVPEFHHERVVVWSRVDQFDNSPRHLRTEFDQVSVPRIARLRTKREVDVSNGPDIPFPEGQPAQLSHALLSQQREELLNELQFEPISDHLT